MSFDHFVWSKFENAQAKTYCWESGSMQSLLKTVHIQTKTSFSYESTLWLIPVQLLELFSWICTRTWEFGSQSQLQVSSVRMSPVRRFLYSLQVEFKQAHTGDELPPVCDECLRYIITRAIVNRYLFHYLFYFFFCASSRLLLMFQSSFEWDGDHWWHFRTTNSKCHCIPPSQACEQKFIHTNTQSTTQAVHLSTAFSLIILLFAFIDIYCVQFSCRSDPSQTIS